MDQIIKSVSTSRSSFHIFRRVQIHLDSSFFFKALNSWSCPKLNQYNEDWHHLSVAARMAACLPCNSFLGHSSEELPKRRVLPMSYYHLHNESILSIHRLSASKFQWSSLMSCSKSIGTLKLLFISNDCSLYLFFYL